MQIEIKALDFPLTEALREFVERRLSYALSRHDDSLREVVVTLSEVAGARGARTKSCRVQVGLSAQPDVIAENVEADMRVAVHRAADRAGWTVARRIQRQRHYNSWRFSSGKAPARTGGPAGIH